MHTKAYNISLEDITKDIDTKGTYSKDIVHAEDNT